MSVTKGKVDLSDSMSSLQLDGAGGGGRKGKKDDGLSMVQSFLHTRPAHIKDKRGTKGQKVTCVTNYIPVDSETDWLLFQYHVRFTPDIDSKNLRIKLLNEHKEELKMREFIIFDGAILFLSWDMGQTTFESLHPVTGEKVTMLVRQTKTLPANQPDCMTLFNLCLRKALQELGLRQFGRYFFNPNDASMVPKHKMEIWPGVISAIRVHEERLLLCCEMAHKMLRTESVSEFMLEIHRKDPARFHENCTQMLVGTTVLARYSNKTYRVDDIVFDKSPLDKFETADGEMDFITYYRKHYGKEIKDPQQPLLMSKVKRRAMPVKGKEPPEFVYLIPELCSMTGLTEQMRKDRRVMQDLAQFTRVPPHNRVKHVEHFAERLNSNEFINKMMASWHLGFGRSAQRVEARVLPQEAVKADRDIDLKYDPKVGDWAREARSYRVTDPKPLKHWVLVYPESDQGKAEQFFNSIKQIGQQIGMQIGMPVTVHLSDTRPSTFLAAIKHGRQQMEGAEAQMVVAMVPNDDKNRYDAIKKHCCLEAPVANQVVRSQSLSKNLMSVCGKIILQMNCKLGGSLWRVQIPMKKAMVIGYDSYYDSSERGKSAGAAVFSLNDEMTRWFSQCQLHGDVLNMVGNLKQFCRNALLKYHDVNGCLPGRILLYRSGCGEGQIPVVYNNELPDVTNAIKEVGEKLGLEYDPKFSFIIVNKRVNTRYLEVKDGSVQNPLPGTVVDSVVTRPERYDFYLVPQRVTQGTVTPVSYNVISDTSGLEPDHMQRMAFKLCHLYYNWQGTVRIPAPCQYAHKLAFLVSQSLHETPREELADKLYFL